MERAKITKSFRGILKLKYIILIFLLIPILILGNKLREYSYATVPAPGESLDEYSFGWLGLSLIQNRYPIAWSGIDAYEDHDFQKINVDGRYTLDPNKDPLAIDKPWFDHPPLFGLLSGGYAYVKGVRNFEDASVIILRRPALKIALVSIFLVYVLAYALFGSNVAILSSIIYATTPVVVMIGRMNLAENGYVPLFLFAVIFSYRFLKTKDTKYWYVANICSASAILFKLSALAIPLYLVLFTLKFYTTKRWQMLRVIVVSTAISLTLFGLYGYYYGFDTFLRVLFANSGRFYGASSEVFINLVTHSVVTKRFTDGWILLGWISFFTLTFLRNKHSKEVSILILSIVAQTVIFLLFGSEAYGHYRIPFYPFLAITTGLLLYRLLQKGRVFQFSMLLLLPMGTAIHRLVGVVGFQKYVGMFRIGVILILILYSLNLINSKFQILSKIIMIALFALSLILSIKLVYFYKIGNWLFAT